MKTGGTYHSPLRASQAAATRERIVAACVALMQRGADLTYASVAAEVGSPAPSDLIKSCMS